MKTILRFFCLAVLLASAIPAPARAGTATLTLQESTNGLGSWQTVPMTSGMLTGDGKINVTTISDNAFYRLQVVMASTNGMSLIPAGSFEMGDKVGSVLGGDGSSAELPVYTVNVSAFYMDKYEVTKALWDEVRAWGLTNGYTDLPVGGGKATNHPVHSINWYAGRSGAMPGARRKD